MKILITAPYNLEGRTALQQKFGEVIYSPWKDSGHPYTEDELIELLQLNKAEALITEHDQVSEKVIAVFPNLRFIGVCRGTPSNVAVKAASLAGIPVFFTPARNAQAVAEMFVSNVICFLRHTLPSISWLKGGNWEKGSHTSYLQFKGNELAGKKVGMIGFGGVGRRIAELLKCFPCDIRFYDPYITDYDPAYSKMQLDELFRSSDIVSVHLPVNRDTMGMIDHSLITLMKSDAIFVNTARACVVNRFDLLEALTQNSIRGAILDVFDNEPPDEIDNKLIQLPNVMATPHTAGATFEVEDHHVSILNKALFEWKATLSLSGLIVNKEMLTERIK